MYSENTLDLGNDRGGKGIKLDYFGQNAITPNNAIGINKGNNGSATNVMLNNEVFKIVFIPLSGNKFKKNKQVFGCSEKKENKDVVSETLFSSFFSSLIPGLELLVHGLEAGKEIGDNRLNKLVINTDENINTKEILNRKVANFISTPMDYQISALNITGLELWQQRNKERSDMIAKEKKENKSSPISSIGGRKK